MNGVGWVQLPNYVPGRVLARHFAMTDQTATGVACDGRTTASVIIRAQADEADVIPPTGGSG